MHITISILFLIQALNVRAAIPDYVYNQAISYQKQHPPYPNIVINVWSGPDCGKTESTWLSFNTDANAENDSSGFVIQSYRLSRDLNSDERLDWSACIEPGTCNGAGTIKGECMRFVQRTSPDSNGNSLLASTCYSLVPGANVSHLSREGLVDLVRTKIEYLVRQSLERWEPPVLHTRRRNKWEAKVTYSAVEQIIEKSQIFL